MPLSFAEERFSRSNTSCAIQLKLQGVALALYGSIGIHPFAAHLYMSLIRPPGVAQWPLVVSSGLLDFLGIPACPPQDCLTRDKQAPFTHNFPRIATTQCEAEVSTQTKGDGLVLEPNGLPTVNFEECFHATSILIVFLLEGSS